jgi:hypothetical protein
MIALPSINPAYLLIMAACVLIVALAIIAVIWRLALTAEYQKTDFFCRLFRFSVETRMPPRLQK